MVLVTHKPVWSGLLQVSWELCLSNLSLCTFFSLATFRYCNWDFFWWMSAVEMHEMQIIYSLGHFCFFTAATTTTQAPTTTTTADPEPEPTSKFSFVKCSSCRQDWKKSENRIIFKWSTRLFNIMNLSFFHWPLNIFQQPPLHKHIPPPQKIPTLGAVVWILSLNHQVCWRK